MSNAPSTKRILGPAGVVYDRLPSRMKNDIDDWLEDRPNKVLYDKNDVLDAWLEWNGIIGFDEDFRELFKALS